MRQLRYVRRTVRRNARFSGRREAVRALTAVAVAAALTAGVVQAWPSSAAGERLFGNPVPYVAGEQPVSQMAAGDLNGDGAADIVTTHYNVAPVSVLLSDGHGSYGPPRDLQGDDLVGQPVLADVDGDGDLDVVLPDRPGPMLNVLVNDGRGRLRARMSDLATADLNRDGALDLAVAHSSTRGLTVLYGDGRGGFGPPARVAPGLRDGRDLTVTDVTADGAPDLVVSSATGDAVLVAQQASAKRYRRVIGPNRSTPSSVMSA